jgi:hypothetical protein
MARFDSSSRLAISGGTPAACACGSGDEEAIIPGAKAIIEVHLDVLTPPRTGAERRDGACRRPGGSRLSAPVATGALSARVHRGFDGGGSVHSGRRTRLVKQLSRHRRRYTLPGMSIEERSRSRAKRIVTHRSHSFEEAERWDLEYWQSLSPASRLSALVAIRRDVDKVKKSRISKTCCSFSTSTGRGI